MRGWRKIGLPLKFLKNNNKNDNSWPPLYIYIIIKRAPSIKGSIGILVSKNNAIILDFSLRNP